MVNMHEAKTNLSKLVAMAEAGEEVIIARNGEPVARMGAMQAAATAVPQQRQFGGWSATIADDFDDPLPEEELALWE